MGPLTKDQHVAEVEQEFSRCTNLISELTQKFSPFGPHRFADGLKRLVESLRDLFHEDLKVSQDLQLPEEDTIATCIIYLHCLNELHEKYIQFLETVPATLIPSRLLLSIISHATKLANKSDHQEFKDFVDIRFMPHWETNYGFFGLRDFPAGVNFPSQILLPVQSRLKETKKPMPEWFVFLHYPRIHARNLLFYPLLFHETAHFWDIMKQCSATIAKNLQPTSRDLRPLYDERIREFRTYYKRRPSAEEKEGLSNDAFREFNELTFRWLGEIVCDLVATHHCGPAYFMAFMDFTTRSDAMRLDSDTHPGADLRLWFILKKLGPFRTKIYHNRFKRFLVGRARQLRKQQLKPTPQNLEDLTLYNIAYKIILRRAKLIINRTLKQLPIPEYRPRTFNKELPPLVHKLKRGYAASDFWSSARKLPPNEPFTIPSILNACWVAYHYHRSDFASLFEQTTPPGKVVENLTDIASQALEGAETLAYWREFTRGKSAISSNKVLKGPPTRLRKISAGNNQGILTRDFIIKLLRKGELTVSPLLDPTDQIEAGSINLRLGTNIITTKRTEKGMLTPAKLSPENIAFFQEKVSYTFGHRFVLHPLELVLASTFEFIALPRDVSAFVLTRSRYGRLGLVVATATYVHPGWKGCLTLELVNYGTVPIELECGAAVAQLILSTAKPIKQPELIQKIPVEPEFSSTGHPDWDVLKRFRDLYGLTDSDEEARMTASTRAENKTA